MTFRGATQLQTTLSGRPLRDKPNASGPPCITGWSGGTVMMAMTKQALCRARIERLDTVSARYVREGERCCVDLLNLSSS